MDDVGDRGDDIIAIPARIIDCKLIPGVVGGRIDGSGGKLTDHRVGAVVVHEGERVADRQGAGDVRNQCGTGEIDRAIYIQGVVRRRGIQLHLQLAAGSNLQIAGAQRADGRRAGGSYLPAGVDSDRAGAGCRVGPGQNPGGTDFQTIRRRDGQGLRRGQGEAGVQGGRIASGVDCQVPGVRIAKRRVDHHSAGPGQRHRAGIHGRDRPDDGQCSGGGQVGYRGGSLTRY